MSLSEFARCHQANQSSSETRHQVVLSRTSVFVRRALGLCELRTPIELFSGGLDYWGHVYCDLRRAGLTWNTRYHSALNM